MDTPHGHHMDTTQASHKTHTITAQTTRKHHMGITQSHHKPHVLTMQKPYGHHMATTHTHHLIRTEIPHENHRYIT